MAKEMFSENRRRRNSRGDVTTLEEGRRRWRPFKWRHDRFVATDKRLILTYGLITQKVALMPLAKATDVSYNRSPPGRLLGYGIFVMESAGQDEALHRVRWVPDPDHTYRAMCAEIFGVDDRERVFDQRSGTSATRTCGVCRARRSRVAAGHPRADTGPIPHWCHKN